MDLQTVEIPRGEARESYVSYRRQAQLEQDPVARRELSDLARAFRMAAKEDVALIALTPTVTRGGTSIRTLVHNKGRDSERRSNYLLPNLAVARADARFCFTLGVNRDGGVQLIDTLRPHPRYRKGVFNLDTGFDLPQGFESGHSIWSGTWQAWTAMVPVVPPKHRPRNGRTDLSKYVVLWEVDKWEFGNDPDAPVDPALLRHVGGDIYAVVATWDLSPLERLVLSGRKLETV